MTRQTRRNGWLVAVMLVILLVAVGAWSQVAQEFTPGEVGGCWFESLNDSPPPEPPAGNPDGSQDGDVAGGVGSVPESEPQAPVSYDGTCYDGLATLTP